MSYRLINDYFGRTRNQLQRRLEEQIIDMLNNSSVDHKRITKELDHYMSLQNITKVRITQILLDMANKIKKDDSKRKLQKVIGHYAVEQDGLIRIKHAEIFPLPYTLLIFFISSYLLIFLFLLTTHYRK